MKREENRKGLKPVPDNPLKFMNEAQVFTCRTMMAIGWHIKFIRRPSFQRPVCVMTDENENTIALIEANGVLNKQPDIALRRT